VIVVDSSKGPLTRQIVERWSARWTAVRYLAAPSTGCSQARNLGVSLTSTDLVLITDDDCLIHEGCVGEVIRTFEEEPEADCVTGAVHAHGANRGQVAVAVKSNAERRAWNGKCRPWGIGHSVNMSFRREAYDWIGGFDEEMGPGTDLVAAEDLDVLYRLLRADGRVVYQPDAIIYHDQWRSRSEARRRRSEYAQGTAAFLLKHALVHRDSYVLRMIPRRLWEDVPLLALIGLVNRNLELELVSLYQAWGLLAGVWIAGRHYGWGRRTLQAPLAAQA
jgi:GT2 family glycosyltransferase